MDMPDPAHLVKEIHQFLQSRQGNASHSKALPESPYKYKGDEKLLKKNLH